MSNVVVAFCMPNVPVPAPGAVGISKVFLDGRKEDAVWAAVGGGFVCGGCTGAGVCRDSARCEVGTGVELGLGDGEGVIVSAGAGAGAGAGVGVGAAVGGGCDMARAGKGGNVESGTDKLGACVTIGYEFAEK